jgi:preprotein translocase subunit SecE
MAKKKSSKKSASSDANVVRIKAGAPSTASKKNKKEATEAVVTKTVAKTEKVEKAKKVEKPAKVKKTRSAKGVTKPFRATGGYFKGAWQELRQVRWPTRRATWSMTGAVLIYTLFFVIIILLLDAGYKYLFELILGK